jgi:thiol-disulfide isomerase/thioredoxin
MKFLVPMAAMLASVYFIMDVFGAQQNQVYQAMAGTSPQGSQSVASGGNSLSSAPQISNEFLEYYSKQGTEFSASIFYRVGTGLEKRSISGNDLRKAVVVFFGDWCPHCEKFLKKFSGEINMLTSRGIKVIFIGVPSVNALKNWKDPTIDDHSKYVEKLRSHGIGASSNVDITALGDRVTLGKASVEGLPAVLAIKDGKEYYRGVGQGGLAKLDFSNGDTLKQFLSIWDPDEKTDESAKEETKQKKKYGKKEKREKAGAWKKGVRRKRSPMGVDLEKASHATAMLNSISQNWPYKNPASATANKKDRVPCGCTPLNRNKNTKNTLPPPSIQTKNEPPKSEPKKTSWYRKCSIK